MGEYTDDILRSRRELIYHSTCTSTKASTRPSERDNASTQTELARASMSPGTYTARCVHRNLPGLPKYTTIHIFYFFKTFIKQLRSCDIALYTALLPVLSISSMHAASELFSWTMELLAFASRQIALQPDQLGAIPVTLRKNRISRQAQAVWSPLPLRAQLEHLLAIFGQTPNVTRREKPWVRTRIVVQRPGVPGRGQCIIKLPTRLPTVWHLRRLILLWNTPPTMWCCPCRPRPIFRSCLLFLFIVDGVSYSYAEQVMMAEKARLFNDHRAVEFSMSSPNPRTHKLIGRGV